MTMEELRDFCDASPRRLGILGGTFDPIHFGHIRLCQAARQEFALDSVILLASGSPPHKPQIALDKELRYAMTELVASREEGLCASRMELDRPGETYTVDTLRSLRTVLSGETELFYIIGADTLLSINTWASPEEVFGLTNFISFSRPGLNERDVEQYVALRLTCYHDRIFCAEEKGPEISSTDIRRRVAQGLPTGDLLPDYVRGFIDERGLYQKAAMPFDEACEKVKQALKPSRYAHTMGVIDASVALAERYGVSSAEARWAALLHDCAKGMSEDEMRRACDDYGLAIDEMTSRAPQLMHAPLGAAIAQNVYGMEDEGILAAIACHSTGRARMTELDKILYLADLIEANRNYTGVAELREAAFQNLDRAVLMGMDQTIRYVLDCELPLHPDTVTARNDLLVGAHLETV